MEDSVNHKNRILAMRNEKRLKQQQKDEEELKRIRDGYQKEQNQARARVGDIYRPSTALQKSLGYKQRRIIEDRSIDDEVDDDDDELEGIEEDPRGEDHGDEELAMIKNQINMINDEIGEKKDVLGQSQSVIEQLTMTLRYEQTQKIEPLEETKEEEEEGEEDSESDEELTQYLQDDDGSDDDDLPEEEERNPYEETLIKLKDKIGLLKHRCESGLGIILFEKAYKLVRTNREKNVSSEKTREQLIEVLGGNQNIGFWAIIDNVLFLEDRKREIHAEQKRMQ